MRVADGAVRIDGRLDEAAWQAAPPITDFVQKEPVEGAVPADAVDVRIVHDGDALYVGARMASRVPIAAPLRFNDRDPQIWGLNIERRVPARNEAVLWSLVPRTESRWASLFGDLHGIAGISPRRRIELLPYAAGSSQTIGGRDRANPFASAANLDGRVGLDAKIGLGSNLTLEATVNPDFGQVEADPAEVNLSAVETFFTERRPFFLEGADLLSGFVNNYFYSRRIGAAPPGRASGDYVDVPRAATILGAAKLTGRLESGTSVGVLSGVTGDATARTFTAGAPIGSARAAATTLFGVARVEQEFGPPGSTVGLMTTLLRRDLRPGEPLASLLTSSAVSVSGDAIIRVKDGEYEWRGYLGGAHVTGAPAAIDRIQRSSAHYFQRPDALYFDYDPTRTSLTGIKTGTSGTKDELRGTKNALCALAVCLFGMPATAPDPAPRPVVTAVRVPAGAEVRIDGVLDEAIWQTARPAADFIQRDPDNGAAATERTEVRVLFEADRLIVGARLFDSEPDRLLGNQMQRDQSFSADDRFIVTLDTFADGRSGYVFQTNPAGAQADALIVPTTNTNNDGVVDFGAGLNVSWDGIWIGRVRRTSEGWTAEMEIPLRTINFDPGLDAWGINFHRTIRRKAEESVWSGHLRNEGVAHMSSAGRLEGLTGLSQGIGLDLKPYVVGDVSSAPGRGSGGVGGRGRVATGDAGADLFYNLTPALRANVSINTDFAETEVDERQVNLTRFPLFFQEKREFFLQGSSYFDFAREIGNNVTPFFSRRLGLDATGVPQPIDVGAKITGQAGAFDVGVLQVRTRGSGDVASGFSRTSQIGSDFTVARAKRRVGRESYVGVLYTRRADRAAGAADLHTAGVDFAARTSTFLGDKTVEWSGWYLHTTNPLDSAAGAASSGGPGGNIGRGSRVAFPNDPFYFDFSYRELQDNYAPAVGFVQRNGFRRYNPEVGYTWRFRNHRWLRSIQQEVDWQWFDDMDNRLLTQNIATRPLTVVFRDGSTLAYELEPSYERLTEEFEISTGVILPAGGIYRFTRHQLEASMADRYRVAVGGVTTWGNFFSGTLRDYGVNLRVRPRSGVAVQAELQRSVIDLAEGSFETNLVRLTANTQFSPWLSLVNNIQYDDVSDALGWQLRFRWIQRPGNDVFFVYTHNWQDVETVEGRMFSTLDNRAAAKVAYTLRF